MLVEGKEPMFSRGLGRRVASAPPNLKEGSNLTINEWLVSFRSVAAVTSVFLIFFLLGIYSLYMSTRYQLTQLMDEHSDAPWVYLWVGISVTIVSGVILSLVWTDTIKYLITLWLVLNGRMAFGGGQQ